MVLDDRAQFCISHNKPTIGYDERESVEKVLNSGWIAQGPRVSEFEEAVSRYLRVGGALATITGTAALHLALLALGIGRGDEVIAPTYVCSAVLNAIFYTGARPVLVDIEADDYNISYQSVCRKLTSATKAIVLPHMYGNPIDLKPFLKLDVPLVEDCAQALGAQWNGQKTGSWGDISICSFYATKLLTTGQGGMVLSNSKHLLENARDLREFDCRQDYQVRYNYKMTDFQAALGLVQLDKLPRFLARRQAIANAYDAVLAQFPFIRRQAYSCGRIFYRYVIELPSADAVSEGIRFFCERGVTVINPLEPYELLHRYLSLAPDDFPHAERIAARTISLPIFPSLTDDEVAHISTTLAAFLSGQRRRKT